MNFLLKAIRASDRHITRFHTERNKIIPFSAFVSIPKALIGRLSGQAKKKPWLVPAAVSWLSRVIQDDWHIFEFGCGYSTAWYAQRCRRVISVEDNPRWYNIVKKTLEDSGLSNWDLKLLALQEIAQSIDSFGDNTFDLVVIDSSEALHGVRVACVVASATKIRPGGFLVLDDSDRPIYHHIGDIFKGWPVRQFVGVKPFPLMATETSIFQRPIVDKNKSQLHQKSF